MANINILGLLLVLQSVPRYGGLLSLAVFSLFSIRYGCAPRSRFELFFLIYLIFSLLISLSIPYLDPDTMVRMRWVSGSPYTPSGIADRLAFFVLFFAAILVITSAVYGRLLVRVPSNRALLLIVCSVLLSAFVFRYSTSTEVARLALPSSGNPNQLGYLLLLSAFLAVVNARNNPSGSRIYLVLLLAICSAGTILSGGRAALVLFLLVVFSALFMERVISRGARMLLFFVAILAAFAFQILDGGRLADELVGNLYVLQRVYAESDVLGLGSRIYILWPSAIERMSNYIIGNGVGSLRVADSAYIRLFHDFGFVGLALFGYVTFRAFFLLGPEGRLIMISVLAVSITNESFVYSVSIMPVAVFVAASMIGIYRSRHSGLYALRLSN